MEENYKSTLEMNPYKVFKISLSFKNDIISTGVDPLMMISKIYDLGDIVESNTNVSKLPNLKEIDPYSFYISWTIVIRSRASKEDLEYVFELIKDGNEISIQEYDETYLSYSTESMMESRIGEVLIEKGLITEEDINNALRVQKRLGEILIEKGIVSEKDIKKALDVQKKLGEILIEEGKVMPNKLEAIIEQQKQVRKFRETNSVRVDNIKLDHFINMVDELLVNQLKINQLVSRSQKDINVEVTDTFKIIETITKELKKQLVKLRSNTKP